MKAFFTSKQFETFMWHTVNAFIGMVIVYISGENMAYAPLVIAGLNYVTKIINVKLIKEQI